MTKGDQPGLTDLPPRDPVTGRAATPLRPTPLRLAATVLGLGVVWGWLADRVLVWAGVRDEPDLLPAVAGAASFFLPTAALVYWLARRQERGVGRATALLRAVTGGTTAVVVVEDRDGKYLLVNEAARFAGKPVAEVLGRDDTALFEPDSARQCVAGDRAVISSGTARTREEVAAGDGTPRTFLATRAPYREEAGAGAGQVDVSPDITARERAEEALRASEERCRALVEASADGVFVSKDGRIVYANPALVRLLGAASPDQVLGKTPPEITHPDDRPAVRDGLQKVIETGQPVPLAGRKYVRLDGLPVDVEVTAAPVQDRGEAAVLVTARDVSARTPAEEALRAGGAWFRAFADHVADGLFLYDRDGTILDVNRQACATLGYTRDELVGRSPADIDPTATPAVLERTAAQLDAGRAITLESRHRRKDGSEFPVEIRIRPFVSGGRRLALALTRDITRRKWAYEELRASLERTQSVIAALAEGIVFLDTGGRICACNASAEHILGLTADQITGRTPFDPHWCAVHEDGSPFPGEDHPTTTTLRTGRACANVVMGVPNSDGGLRWVSVNSEPVTRAGEPGLRGVVASFADITDRKRAQDALVRRKQILEQIATGAPLGTALDAVVGLVEEQLNGSVCSILLLDADGRLRTGSAKGLPAEYNAAIDGLAIGPGVGSCGTAAYRGETVVVADIATDPLWEGGRELALVHGLRACWSAPILAAQKADAPARTGRRVLGTFALYRHEPGAPTPYELEVVAGAAHLAGVAIEREAAECVIRESEERYRRLMDVLPAAVFVHADGKIAFCNPAFVRLVGAADADALLGRSLLDVTHPDYHDLVRVRLGSAEATGVEMRVVRADGQSVPVYSVSAPMTDRGRPSYLVALSDLTERERSQDLLRSVMASVPDPIITVTEEGRIVTVNAATERLFGYPAAELIGQDIRLLAPGPDRARRDAYLAAYLRPRGPKALGTAREMVHRRKDGSVFPGEMTLTEFRLDGRRHFTGVIRDVTARKKLEGQFRKAQKMEAVGRLAGGIAHDFNNLLTIINGYSELTLSALPPEDPNRPAVAAVLDAGERAARLTQQLLAFSRQAVVEPAVLDLNGVLGESLKLFRRLVGEGIVLTTRLDPALARIKIDPGQLEQVILNLVVNARDAMPTGGRLTIETRNVTLREEDRPGHPGLAPGPYVRLTVTDTGCGMPAEVRARIFEPFFTTKGFGKGTGLGLPVVHGAVKQAGGHVSVCSKVGAGTTFALLFPAVADAPRGLPAGAADAPPWGAETVLLVEAEEAARATTRASLQAQGYTVLDAAGGADAIRAAEEYAGPIHLLITDAVLPEIGGCQLADLLREKRPGLGVLYTSGEDDAVGRRGAPAGAFIQKPFTPLGLARKVRAVLDELAGRPHPERVEAHASAE